MLKCLIDILKVLIEECKNCLSFWRNCLKELKLFNKKTSIHLFLNLGVVSYNQYICSFYGRKELVFNTNYFSPLLVQH